MSTQNIPFSILKKKKKKPKLSKICSYGIFQETQERVPNSRGKIPISVRATEGLLY